MGASRSSQMPSLEEQIQPHMESSTEAMDTDKGQRTLSERGEGRPTPSEMRAGLLVGSFSPFDFDKEFQTRHGVRPEDTDKPYHSHHSSRESSIVAVPPE